MDWLADFDDPVDWLRNLDSLAFPPDYSGLVEKYLMSGLQGLLAVPLAALVIFEEFTLRHYLRRNGVIFPSGPDRILPRAEKHMPFLRALMEYRQGRGAPFILEFSFQVGAHEWQKLRRRLERTGFGAPAIRAVRAARETYLASQRRAFARRHSPTASD